MEQMVKENQNVNVEQECQKPKKKIWKGILFSILALIAAFVVLLEKLHIRIKLSQLRQQQKKTVA